MRARLEPWDGSLAGVTPDPERDAARASRAVRDLRKQQDALRRFESRGSGDDINARMPDGIYGGTP